MLLLLPARKAPVWLGAMLIDHAPVGRLTQAGCLQHMAVLPAGMGLTLSNVVEEAASAGSAADLQDLMLQPRRGLQQMGSLTTALAEPAARAPGEVQPSPTCQLR